MSLRHLLVLTPSALTLALGRATSPVELLDTDTGLVRSGSSDVYANGTTVACGCASDPRRVLLAVRRRCWRNKRTRIARRSKKNSVTPDRH